MSGVLDHNANTVPFGKAEGGCSVGRRLGVNVERRYPSERACRSLRWHDAGIAVCTAASFPLGNLLSAVRRLSKGAVSVVVQDAGTDVGIKIW